MTENSQMRAAEVWDAMLATDFPFALVDPSRHVYVDGNAHYADLLRVDLPELKGFSVLRLYGPTIAGSIVSLHGAFARGTLDSTRGQVTVRLPSGEIVELKGWARRFEGMSARRLVVTSAAEADSTSIADDRFWVALAPHVFGRPDPCETSWGTTERRVHELEGHLWRIGHEVRDAGLFPGLEVGQPTSIKGFDELSPRQREIVARLLGGERVTEIARALYLSPSTVRNHLTAVFRKFGVHSQIELLSALRDSSSLRP